MLDLLAVEPVGVFAQGLGDLLREILELVDGERPRELLAGRVGALRIAVSQQQSFRLDLDAEGFTEHELPHEVAVLPSDLLGLDGHLDFEIVHQEVPDRVRDVPSRPALLLAFSGIAFLEDRRKDQERHDCQNESACGNNEVHTVTPWFTHAPNGALSRAKLHA